MKCLLVSALAACALGARQEYGVNPIRRIVNLMQKMQAEVTAEGEKEKDLYDKFMCYCDGNNKDLGSEISGSEAAIESLTAEIKSKTGRKNQLDAELKQHKADRNAAQQALAEATQIREKEHGEFVKENGDANANINALGKAIGALDKGMGKAMLLQAQPMALSVIKKALFKSSNIADVERQTVMSFLDAKSPYGDYQASSGEIVGILKQLKDEMEKDLGSVLDEERNAQKAYDELASAKRDEINAATASIEAKQVSSGEIAVEIVNAKNDLANEKKELTANQQFQLNLKQECAAKTADFNARTATRNEELMALSDAVKYLNSDDALELFKKTLSSPTTVGTVFLQKSLNNRRTQGYAILQAASSVSTQKGTQLALMANMLKSGVDFSKVVKMIDDMADVMKKEQKDDDAQVAAATKTLEEKNDEKKALERKIKDHNAAVDDMSAQISQLSSEIGTLNANIKTLDKEVSEATSQRKAENEEALKTQQELTLTLDLLKHVKNRLNKFYNPDQYIPPPTQELTEEERIAQNLGEQLPTAAPQEFFAGSGLTRGVDDREQAPDAATYEKSSKSTGVMALMDQVMNEAKTSLEESEHDEKAGQAAYEELMADSKKSREEMSKSLVGKESEMASLEGSLNDEKNARASTTEELMATNQYLSEVHSANDWLIENYDARKEARAAEMDNLVKAKAVLSGADFQ